MKIPQFGKCNMKCWINAGGLEEYGVLREMRRITGRFRGFRAGTDDL